MSPERQAILDLSQQYRLTFASEAGQAVLRDLIKRFGYTRTTTLEAGRPDVSAWREGQRAVLVHVGKMIDLNPSSVPEDVSHATFDADA